MHCIPFQSCTFNVASFLACLPGKCNWIQRAGFHLFTMAGYEVTTERRATTYPGPQTIGTGGPGILHKHNFHCVKG